ncbi:MAG TPA: DUF5069 domain-containing protein [Candidatus Eremiobacteraceae bacterium]|nr:DUF5069 domain-containing protein [Candidatus Eremiobacteraceae bacterium]
MDLTTSHPRSPRDRLDGIPMLPRTIDKARAHLAGKLGEYRFGDDSGYDRMLFDTLGIDPETFLDGIRQSPDDAAVLRWLHANARTVAARDDQELIEGLEAFGLESDEDRAELKEHVAANAPAAVRDKIKTWLDWIDFDEGRIK